MSRLSIGLFNSIMFPVIFTLTLERSSASEEATSGLLCTAIIGGALIPPLVGMVSGQVGYATALIVPAACYFLLCLFSLAAGRAQDPGRTISSLRRPFTRTSSPRRANSLSPAGIGRCGLPRSPQPYPADTATSQWLG